MRINARLDEEDAHKLSYIQQQTHQTVTDAIRTAIDLYFQQLQQQKPLDLLTQNGFIGCGEAEPDLSLNYKSILQNGLKGKYGDC
ncbi:ribbon-helix-helix domain-containing protein [Nodularia spumigena CS-584]|jgi:hypothetical protein|uniref:Ribbon-helix-helix domain-containing protein n=1 Tax=Nodularia spumigena UHCC 0060 TaxID=3110300 RepID=A0ABU5UT87_NODSP|nr:MULTISPECIES: ribbon-helix-helix domain-containing protein [Cyanophyceae]AHJ27642.1 hypothetical protein NSP_13020 [Nodularia spumigena CCY9414]EAW44986.1 hypothetical protein N9414_06649 [Nodularia spumigena CCY9414]MDB9306361.1 ribbon-helix-helix domain-containing protein [Nodularia spumigena CS-591/12]MDB9316108.1 ribbon-helix-helix domain-containing protein [Nodularia spumigena CS-590/01A]MDB9320542.1 ribbon-helix-helix domain-containing protein [Nodularia spumigena CS-591/07A]